VLTNLVANGLRYTAAGGQITVSAGESGAFVEVNVRDNGQGIPYENQARIFDKFFQVKDKAERRGSLGIGLAICKEIVKAHQGIIWVESTPGEGSTFSFTLPKAAAG
jgi:NtrC-family two-component system sensor histidine kinase KinB